MRLQAEIDAAFPLGVEDSDILDHTKLTELHYLNAVMYVCICASLFFRDYCHSDAYFQEMRRSVFSRPSQPCFSERPRRVPVENGSDLGLLFHLYESAVD